MFPVYPKLWAMPEYREPAEELLALCAERDVGVMAIKAAARRPWSKDQDHWAGSWYEPHHDDDAIERGVRFALSTPGVHAFCTPGDIALLPRVLDVADAYRPLSADERADAVDSMREDAMIFPIPTG
jgi:hypothetical protein